MKKVIFSLSLMLILTSFVVYGAGLGVAPATLNFKDALIDSVTEKQLTIQNPGDEAILVSINVEGELSDWIKLSSGKVEIPGKGSAKISVLLTPTEVGEYTSKFKVRAESTAEVEGSGMGLLPGVDTSIVATVTDEEIIKGEVSKILTKDENYGDPVKFTIGFTNYGNVAAGPSVKIDIVKRGSGIIDTIEEELDEINPGADTDYVVEWDTKGKETNVYYRANIVVSLDGEVIEEKEEVGFRILEKTYEKPSNLVIGIIIIVII